MPITSIIFSKDRPLQLDLFLSSMETHDVNDIFEEKIIIFKYSSPEYKEAYETLRKEYPNVCFWEQNKSIFYDVDVAVTCCLSEYVAFFTDDNIFYNDVMLTDGWTERIFENRFVSHISLRLGANTQYRADGSGGLIKQGVGEVTSVRKSDASDTEWENMFLYDRSIHYYGGYWNYPISLDGHVFKQETVQGWTQELCYIDPIKKWKQNPNELERAFQRFVQECPPLVMVPPMGCVVNSPNNQVSDYFDNNNGINSAGDEFPTSVPELLGDFCDGYRINHSLLKPYLSSIVCPHQEVDIIKAMVKEVRDDI